MGFHLQAGLAEFDPGPITTGENLFSHQMSLNIAAGLGLGGNESYPEVFQPYGGFPDSVAVEDRHIVMPDLPGIGFEGKADLYAHMQELAS